MADVGENVRCRMCFAILSKKGRRYVFADTFNVTEQLAQVVDCFPSRNDLKSPYVCSFCFTKLNRLSKLDFDILHKVSALQAQRCELLGQLRNSHRQGKALHDLSPATPKKSSGKRGLLRSPTPRKVKIPGPASTPESVKSRQQQRRVDPPGPPPISMAIDTAAEIPVPATVQSKARKRLLAFSPCKPSKSKEFTPGKVKVSYRISSETPVRTKSVEEVQIKDLIKCLARGNSTNRIAMKMLNPTSKLRQPIEDSLIKEVKQEMANLCKRGSYLYDIASSDLQSFSFEEFHDQVKQLAPFLYKLLECLTNQSKIIHSVIVAILMRCRNNHLSRLHHIVAQVLDLGGATDETIEIMGKLGLSVGPSALAKRRVALEQGQQEKIERLVLEEKRQHEDLHLEAATCKSSESAAPASTQIIGDNVDITRTRAQMTKDRQRKSWHWFLLVGVPNRVTFPLLPDDGPQTDIVRMENATFIPSAAEQKDLNGHFTHHIMHVLVNYIPFLRDFSTVLPTHINHPYMEQTSKKSEYVILDLLDKNENKNDDMVCILKHVHKNYVSHTKEDDPMVIKKKVFGGDVLTNERAYEAQIAMLNSPTDYTRLQGIVHRPEGLHRMMNFLGFIYQRFYLAKSAGDAGTLYQLRNVMGRLDVAGGKKVTEAYRAHLSLVEDTLDSYIVGSCMHMLGMKDLDEEPPMPEFLTSSDRLEYIRGLAENVLTTYVHTSKDLEAVREAAEQMAQQKKRLENMRDPDKQLYVCAVCNKQYKTVGWLQQHLTKIHRWDFETDVVCEAADTDHVAIYRSSFMKCALILRDTLDAYKLWDGDRILRNAKCEMLCADVAGHTKYRLWLFRFIAYCVSLLSPRQAMEYKWNCTSSTAGGFNNNIPNDNLVELLVQSVKKKVHQQGSNAVFESARRATLAIQMQEEIRANIAKESGVKPAGKKRPAVNKGRDVKLAIAELNKSKVFDIIPGRQFDGFPQLRDVFRCVKTRDLCEWLNEKKEFSVLPAVVKYLNGLSFYLGKQCVSFMSVFLNYQDHQKKFVSPHVVHKNLQYITSCSPH